MGINSLIIQTTKRNKEQAIKPHKPMNVRKIPLNKMRQKQARVRQADAVDSIRPITQALQIAPRALQAQDKAMVVKNADSQRTAA